MFVYKNDENCLSIGSSRCFSETSVIWHSSWQQGPQLGFALSFSILKYTCLFALLCVLHRPLFSLHPPSVHHNYRPFSFHFTGSRLHGFNCFISSWFPNLSLFPTQTSALNSILVYPALWFTVSSGPSKNKLISSTHSLNSSSETCLFLRVHSLYERHLSLSTRSG